MVQNGAGCLFKVAYNVMQITAGGALHHKI